MMHETESNIVLTGGEVDWLRLQTLHVKVKVSQNIEKRGFNLMQVTICTTMKWVHHLLI